MILVINYAIIIHIELLWRVLDMLKKYVMEMNYMNKRILLASFLLLFVVVFTVGCNSISAFKQSESVIEPALLMFSGSNENINSGELYIQEIGGEKEKLANTALKDEYLMAPNSHAVLLLNDENELYLKKYPAKRKQKFPVMYCLRLTVSQMTKALLLFG